MGAKRRTEQIDRHNGWDMLKPEEGISAIYGSSQCAQPQVYCVLSVEVA